MGFPVTINGNTYAESDFAPFGYVTNFPAIMSDLAAVAPAIQSAASSIGGAWLNSRLAKTANYTVLNADKGRTLALGGAGYFTLTFGTASGYDANFAVTVINEDSGRAKRIVLTGGVTFKLPPLQTAVIYNSNNVWQANRPTRWKHPGGTLNLYADFTNGDDSANDGLAAGAGNAFKTVQAALYFLLDQVDFTGTAGGQTQAVVNMAASTTDTTGVHFSGPFVGAQGGAAVTILGTSGSVIGPTNVDAIGLFCNAILQIQGVTLQSTNQGALSVGLGAKVYILTGCIFGACAGPHIACNDPGSHVIINANYQISGGAAEHMLAQNGGIIQSVGSYTATWSANASFTYFALAGTMGAISVPNMTYNLNSFTCNGKRYEADNLALIYTGGGGASYFPGNSAGSVSTGGIYS